MHIRVSMRPGHWCSRLPRHLFLASTVFFSALSVGFAQHVEQPPEQMFKVSGFGTLGLTHHNNPELGVASSLEQKVPAWDGWSGNLDSLIGLQLDWNLGQSTSVVTQAVSRASNEFGPELRMGYVRQQFGNDFAVRLGRIRNPTFFDSGVTEIGYANLAVRPPVAVYFISNSIPSLNGGDVQWRGKIGSAALLVQGATGGMKYKLSGVGGVADELEIHNLRVLALSLSLPNITLRASHSVGKLFEVRAANLDALNAGLAQLEGGLTQLSMNPSVPAPIQTAVAHRAAAVRSLGDPFEMRQPTYTSLAFSSLREHWSLQGEVIQYDSGSKLWGRYLGYQLTVGRNFGEITPYLSVALTRARSSAADLSALDPTGLDPTLDAQMALLQGGLKQAEQSVRIDARCISAGVRWDFKPDMSLKLQYDIFGNSRGNSIPRNSPATNYKVNLLSATLDFVF